MLCLQIQIWLCHGLKPWLPHCLQSTVKLASHCVQDGRRVRAFLLPLLFHLLAFPVMLHSTCLHAYNTLFSFSLLLEMLNLLCGIHISILPDKSRLLLSSSSQANLLQVDLPDHLHLPWQSRHPHPECPYNLPLVPDNTLTPSLQRPLSSLKAETVPLVTVSSTPRPVLGISEGSLTFLLINAMNCLRGFFSLSILVSECRMPSVMPLENG